MRHARPFRTLLLALTLLPAAVALADDRPARRLHAHEVLVLHADGTPAAGATATVVRTLHPEHYPRAHAPTYNQQLFAPPVKQQIGILVAEDEATADAKGVLRIQYAPGEHVQAVVRSGERWLPGLWTATPISREHAPRRLVLDAARRIQGRVHIAGEGVQAYITTNWSTPSHPWPCSRGWGGGHRPQNVPTAPDGRFEVTVPEGAQALLWVYAAGRYRRQMIRAAATGSEALDIRLDAAAGGRVHGRILKADGSPIAGARVWVGVDVDPAARTWTPMGPGHDHIGMTVSDADGRYVIDGLDPGYVKSVSAFADGYIVANLGHLAFRLSAGVSREVDLALDRVVPVTGRVLDEQDRPVAHAWVSMSTHTVDRLAAYSTNMSQAVTDAEGRYRLEGIPSTQAHLQVQAPGYALLGPSTPPPGRRRGFPVMPQVKVPASGAVEAPTLRMRRGVPVEGWVITPQGTPVPHVYVNPTFTGVVPVPGEAPPPPISTSIKSARTDAAGRFRFPGLRDNARYTLTPVGALPGSSTMPIEIRDGKAPTNVRLVWRPGSTLSGRVTFDDGSPVPFAQLGVKPGRVTTVIADAQGNFHIPGVPRGEATVRVMRVDNPGSSQVLEVDGEAPYTGIHLRIQGTGVLRVRVTDADGKPLPGKSANIRHARFTSHQPAWASTDPDGRFELTHMPIGTYTVVCEGVTKMIDVGAEPAEATLEVAHAESWLLEGEVVDAEGRPVPRATLFVRVRDHSHRTFPVVSGRFLVQHWDIRNADTVDFAVLGARDALGRPLDLAPTLLEGYGRDAPPPVLRMTPAKVVRGVLRDSEGKPFVGIKLQYVPTERPWWTQGKIPEATTDAEGRFAFDALFPEGGDVRVLQDERLATLPAKRGVMPGDPRVELTAERAHSISGRVVDDTGKVLANMRVSVFVDRADVRDGDQRRHLRTTTAEDGTWQVHGMRRDRIWTVSVEAQRRGDVSFMPFKRRLPTWPTEPLTLTLRRYVPIEGRVVTPEGRPIERFRVYL
nr:carboxypeptidase-like regulatory domain-containing protein [Planctomycetota bacterium]